VCAHYPRASASSLVGFCSSTTGARKTPRRNTTATIKRSFCPRASTAGSVFLISDVRRAKCESTPSPFRAEELTKFYAHPLVSDWVGIELLFFHSVPAFANFMRPHKVSECNQRRKSCLADSTRFTREAGRQDEGANEEFNIFYVWDISSSGFLNDSTIWSMSPAKIRGILCQLFFMRWSVMRSCKIL